MPLLLRKIENHIAYGDKALYEDSNEKTILKDVGFAGKVGTVAQITVLASLAQEIFSGILGEVQTLNDRIQSIAKRTDVVSCLVLEANVDPAVLPPIDAAREFVVARTSSLLCKETVPRTIQTRYESVQPMPALQEVDPFLGPTQFQKLGETAKHYSDPGIFLKKWIACEDKKIAKTKDERDNRKAEKKAMRQKMEKEMSTLSVGSADDPTGQIRQKKKSANWRDR
jgi:hypothetical protein